jgi:hypothetical protein
MRHMLLLFETCIWSIVGGALVTMRFAIQECV